MAINLPKSSFEGSPLLPFPSVTCVQAQAQGLYWKLSSQTWEQEAGCKGTTQPHPEVCQALASLPLHLKYSLEREWEAGGSPGTMLCFCLAERLRCETLYELLLVWKFWVGLQCFTANTRDKLLLTWAASISVHTPWCSAQPQPAG